jgi:uncharacterized protein (TIGR03032 family)
MDSHAAPAAPAVTAPAEIPAEGEELLSVQTESLGPLFAELGMSLAVSTYQAGKLIMLRHQGGVVATHFRNCTKPMGLAAVPGMLVVGALGEIQFYSDVKDNCGRIESDRAHDACFVPRMSHSTGDIDIHDLAVGKDNVPWFINTRFSALCTIGGSTSFRPVWRPDFITAYAPEDRCHLNGLGLYEGMPRFVTALGESDTAGGWRARKADGGLLFDLATRRVLCRGLSMPHSPRWYDNRLWVCESGKGTLSLVDLETGALQLVAELPGFTRGLDFCGPYAFIGLSQIRESATFSGIPIAERAAERNCGIWVVDIRNGRVVAQLKFTQGVQEIFAVQVLPGIRYPEVLGKYDKLALDTYFLPSEVLRQVPAAAPKN